MQGKENVEMLVHAYTNVYSTMKKFTYRKNRWQK